MAEKESNEHDSGTASDSNQEPHESSDSSTSEAAVRLAKLRDHQLRKLRFLPVIACLFFVITTYFGEPRCTNGLTAKNNQDTSKYRMLSRTESVTGWITVSDEAKRDLRLLRSGHSIIGGHWNSTTESIFGIFYYPDAVRLIKGRASNPNAKRTGKGKRSRLAKNALIGDGSERALQIGLGIGVSARSLHEQNVRVDVAEIDPAVYQAAVDFFLLPKNLNGVYLEDGRQFIDKAPAHTYDYIVHDVFTGGSVPSSLFSQSAVAQLHRILKPDGVLAMNYVGIPADTRTLYHVLHTLRTSFAHVRCFAESTKDLNTMTNMMFFASDEPIEFDIAPEVLSAMGPESIRARMLADMEKNEISLDGYKPEEARAITDEWNPLTEWQFDTAIQHWKAMREMFPSEYWLNY
ncbi:hypothetical protein GGI12_003940 [Dipsacomyces acuminosporus]|nr:hypothetical protein GGI12_003940 [Dipsacomyces acuminosporus]